MNKDKNQKANEGAFYKNGALIKISSGEFYDAWEIRKGDLTARREIVKVLRDKQQVRWSVDGGEDLEKEALEIFRDYSNSPESWVAEVPRDDPLLSQYERLERSVRRPKGEIFFHFNRDDYEGVLAKMKEPEIVKFGKAVNFAFSIAELSIYDEDWDELRRCLAENADKPPSKAWVTIAKTTVAGLRKKMELFGAE